MHPTDPTQARAPLPSDIWETNGGIYFGYTVEGRTDQRRPLAGQEDAPVVPRREPLRTTWKPDGKRNLFTGEGHIALFGNQGSGKSRKLLMVNLLRLRNWSMVVMDTKGEMTAYSAVERAKNGHKVYVVDPTNHIKRTYPKLYNKYPEIFASHGYNPVAALDPESPFFADAARALAKALISTEGTNEIHFPQGAQMLAKGLLMALRKEKPGVTDNLSALRLMLAQQEKELVKKVGHLIDRHGATHKAIASSLNEFTTPLIRDKDGKPVKDEKGMPKREAWRATDDRELHGIRRTASIQTDWLDSPLFQADLRRDKPIDFESFKKRPQTVYFVLPPEYLEDFGVWLRIMISSALRPLMRSVEDAEVPVLFMLDEAATLGNLEILSKNIGQMRSFGLKLWTVWQSISQLEPIYDKAWKNILSLSEAKITFGTSHDIDTAEYFSRLSGERLYKHKMKSESFNETSGWSTGTNAGFSFGGGSHTSGTSDGKSGGTSYTRSKNEVFQSERVIKTYELNALNADEAVIFSRMGKIRKTICPQPDILPSCARPMEQARADIEGRQPLRRMTINDMQGQPSLVVNEPD